VHIRFSFPLPIPDSGDAPSEFRIWKWGENKTLKGTVVLDEASAKAVVNAFRDHGVELAIDYEHQTFNAEDNGKEAPAAGWFTPEVREDGLWATAVRWTDRASAYLKAKEYRYFSPVALWISALLRSACRCCRSPSRPLLSLPTTRLLWPRLGSLPTS
jgi:hypothetical protein